MFELKIGHDLTVPSTLFSRGVLLTGRAGQGKSTTFIDVALQAITHGQRGLIIDPYGDLANAIREKCVSVSSKKQVAFFGIEATRTEIGKALKAGKMAVVAATWLTDGERRTKEKMQKFFKSTFGLLQKGDWFIMDECFGFTDDRIFNMFLDFRKKKLHALFCDQGISRLSEKERRIFCKAVSNYLVYKCGRYDALGLVKSISAANRKTGISPGKIANVEAFNFLSLIEGSLSNHHGIWPIRKI